MKVELMKVHTRELHPELEVTITGNEAWLSRIYSDFLVPEGAVKPLIAGSLQLRLEEAGTVVARGSLAYAPFVSCARCEKPIPWPLDMSVNVRYSPDFGDDEAFRGEKTLSKAELDEYFLTANELDLEELINDTIYLNLPTHLIAYSDRGDTCRVCLDDIKSDLVFGPGETKPESPFAKLLKDPQAAKIKH